MERHLEELVRLNERLLAATERRREAMITRDTERLELLMAEEARLAKAIAEEEQRRQVTMIRLGGELGRRPEELATTKLADLAVELGPETGSRLLELRERLQGTVRRVMAINQTMSLLARRLLPYFNELLEILLTGAPGRRAYTRGGRAVRTRRSAMSVLDMKV
jgi:hypothetical protein